MIAVYVHALVATGVARQATIIADTLLDAGYEVEMVTALPSPNASTVLLEGPLRWRWLEHAVAALAMRRYIARARPALIVSAGNHGHGTIWAATRGNYLPRRIYRISNDILRAHRAVPAGSPLRAAGRRMMARLIARDAAHIVMVSPTLLATPAYARASARGCASVIDNGVDVAAARTKAVGPAPHPWLGSELPTVVAVGRLAPQKNFGTLLTAMALLQRQRPARLILLGESRDKARAKLLRHARGLGLADRLAMPGTVDNIFPWLAHADAFVLPSWWEGSANVLLEAMAVGTPVVASASAGNAAALLDGGKFGRLIDPADSEGLANALAAQLDQARVIMPGDRILDYDIAIAKAAWLKLIRRRFPALHPLSRLPRHVVRSEPTGARDASSPVC